LTRLRRRKLVQWALAYLAAAWVIVESSSLVVEQFGWPSVIGQVVIVLAGIGFLGVLVLAWYHGEQGRQRVSGPELLMLATLFAIAAAVVSLVGRPRAPEAVPDAARPTDRLPVDPRPSIAVLPFADMSPGGDQEYFADGVSEEILNAITKLPGLRVAARTSSFSFKGTGADIKTVAERLSVGTVLDGSVRKENGRVRITAQLISAEDGFHLWSDAYDRELESVFAVQDEIAREIVRALRTQLVGAGDLSIDIPTTSPDAYEAYLRARHAIGTASLPGWRQALGLLTRALELDPAFAPAHASLAMTHLLLGWFGERPFLETVPLVRTSAARALELDDRLSDAHAVTGYLALYHDWDWPAAERWFLRALDLNPNDAIARHGYGDLLSILGDGEAGLRQVELGRQADPLSPLAVLPVLGHKVFLGRFDEVIQELDSLRVLFPDRREIGRDFVASALWNSGQRREALDHWIESWPEDPALHEAVERTLAEAGPVDAMRVWADYRAEQVERGRGGAYSVAVLYGRAGDAATALEWLWRAHEARSWSLLHVTLDPAFDALRSEPAYGALLEAMGIPS
jgi:serine/threonine-protein kinase